MFDAYESVTEPGPFAFDTKIPYVPWGFFGSKKVDVADRNEPYHDVIPILPVPSPPFHQIWLPSPRKLQTVRFSIHTLSVLKATIPERPELFGPKVWSARLAEHRGVPGLVPSTTTALRFMPRRCSRVVSID